MSAKLENMVFWANQDLWGISLNVKIQMQNKNQMTKYQILLYEIWVLAFDIHLKFELCNLSLFIP